MNMASFISNSSPFTDQDTYLLPNHDTDVPSGIVGARISQLQTIANHGHERNYPAMTVQRDRESSLLG
jgi:hypothetical protein